MTKAEITERIAQGEDSRTQFKRGPIGIAKLAAELVAFSNASGGSILFGVDDDGNVVGLGVKRVTEITKHVEFISDSEANFFTAKVYRQEHAPIKPVDAPVSCPINSPDCPINPHDCPVNPHDCPISPHDCPINPNAEEMSDTAIRLLETIKANPGIGKKTISTVSGLSVRNIKFHIEHSLRGKVEFRGAKKTGGYYIVAESKTQRTKAKKRKQ